MEDNTIGVGNGINKSNLISLIPQNDSSENVSDEEKRKKWEHLLTLINEISVNLDHIQEEEKRTLCEKYRAVLQQLKEYISPRSSFGVLKKCEVYLRKLLKKIDMNKINDLTKKPFIRSPDSTALHVDLTSGEDKSISVSQLLECYSPSNSVENQPDSTVTEGVSDSCCRNNDTYHSHISPNNTDNEVSSSENVNKPQKMPETVTLRQQIIDVDEILRDVREKGSILPSNEKKEEFKTQNQLATSSSKVHYIMNMAKQMTSSKVTENAERTVKISEEHLFDNHFDSNYPNEDLHERLSELMKAPTSAIERISDEVVDLFSRYSTTTEVADTSIKEAISNVEAEDADDVEAWDKKAESVILNDSDKPICQPENSVQVDKSSISENICNTDSTLSVTLQRVIELTGIREKFSEATIVDEDISQQNTQILSPGSKISSPVLLPPLSPAVVPTKKNCHVVSASMVEVGRRNLISKLSQEIGVIHKVGDSNRITPSLKLLKNDLKKPPPCANSSFSNMVTISGDHREKPDEESNMPRDPRLLPISARNTRSSLLSAINVPVTKRVDPRLEMSLHKIEKTRDTDSNMIIEPQLLLESSVAPSEDITMVSFASKNSSKDCRPYSTRTAPPISMTYPFNLKNSKQSLSPTFISRMKDRNRMRLSTSDSYSNKFAQNRSNKKHNQNCRLNERSLDLFDDKNRSPTDLKDMIKEKNEFFSPLAGIYSDMRTPRTGIGYGYQKFKSTFKIPKISKANDSGDKKPNEVLLPKSNKNESFSINVGNELQLTNCEEKIERKSCSILGSSNGDQQNGQLQKNKKNKKKQAKELELESENFENSSNQRLKTENSTTSNEDERNEIMFTVKKCSVETPIHQKLDKNDANNVVSNKMDIITIGNNKKEDQRNVKTEDPNNVKVSNNKVVSTVANNEGDTINRECRTADHRSKVFENREKGKEKFEHTTSSHSEISEMEKETEYVKEKEDYLSLKRRFEKNKILQKKNFTMNLRSDNTSSSYRTNEMSESSDSLYKDDVLIRNINNTNGNSEGEEEIPIHTLRFGRNRNRVAVDTECKSKNSANIDDCKVSMQLSKQQQTTINSKFCSVEEIGETRLKQSSDIGISLQNPWTTLVNSCCEKCSCADDILRMCNSNETQVEGIATLLSETPSISVTLSSSHENDDHTVSRSRSKSLFEDHLQFAVEEAEGKEIIINGEKCVQSLHENKTVNVVHASLSAVASSDVLNEKSLKNKNDDCVDEYNWGDNKCDNDDDDLKFLTRLKSIPSLKNALKDTDSKQKSWFANLILSLDQEKLEVVQAALKNKSLTFHQDDDKNKKTVEKIETVEPKEDLGEGDEEQVIAKADVLNTSESKHKSDELEVSFTGNQVAQTSASSDLYVKLEKQIVTSDVAAQITLNECSYDVKKAPLNKNRRRGMTELDRLHADIKKMKRTKNNIFTAIGPRSCRRQPPIYTDRAYNKNSLSNTSSALSFVVCNNKSKKKSSLLSSSDLSSSIDTEEEILTGRLHQLRSNKSKGNQKAHSVTTASDDLSGDSSSSEPSSSSKIKKRSRFPRNEVDSEFKSANRNCKNYERQQTRLRKQQRSCWEQQPLSSRSLRRLRRQQQLEDDNSDTSVSNRPEDGEEEDGKGAKQSSIDISRSSNKFNVETNYVTVYKPCPKQIKFRRYGPNAFTEPYDCLPTLSIVLTKLSAEEFSINKTSTILNVNDGGNKKTNLTVNKNTYLSKVNTEQVADHETVSGSADQEVMNADVKSDALTDMSLPPPLSLIEEVSVAPYISGSLSPPSLSPHSMSTQFKLDNKEHVKLKKSKKKKKKQEMRVKPLKLTRLNNTPAAPLVCWNLSSSEVTTTTTTTTIMTTTTITAAVSTTKTTMMSTSTTKMSSKKKTEEKENCCSVTAVDQSFVSRSIHVDNKDSKEIASELCCRLDAVFSSVDQSVENITSISRHLHADDDDSEEIASELRLNERIASLPSCNAFCEDVTSIHIASILIIVKSHTEQLHRTLLSYKCLTDSCNYDTDEVQMFANHLSFAHKDVVWDCICPLCTSPVLDEISVSASPDLIDVLVHVTSKHLTTVLFAAEQQQFKEQSVNEFLVTIKEEPVEKHSENETVKVEKIEKDIMMTPSKVTTEVPRLRVRRFSGDILSGNCNQKHSTESSSIHKTTDLGLEVGGLLKEGCSSETLPFVITDVKTLQQSKTPDENFQPDNLQSSRNEQRGSTSFDSSLQTSTKIVTADDTIGSPSIVRSISHSNMNKLDTARKRSSDKNKVKKKVSNNNNDDSKLTPASLQLSLNENRLVNLYKCSELQNCLFSTNSSLEFCRHLRSNHKLRKKSRKVDSKYLKCLYCNTIPASFGTAELLVKHLDNIHRFCQYLCPYCVFRACRPVYVLWHLENKHVDQVKKIVTLKSEDNVEAVKSNSPQKPYNEVVHPINCAQGCSYTTVSLEEFANHSKILHSEVQMLKCHVCDQVTFKLDKLLNHYKLHNIAEFQCVYCVACFSNISNVQLHLLTFHSALYPKAVKRRSMPLSSIEVTDSWSKFVFSVDLDESLESLSQHVKIVNSNEFSQITLYRDESGDTGTPSELSVLSLIGHVVDNVIRFDTNQESQCSDVRDDLTTSVDNKAENTMSATAVKPNREESFNLHIGNINTRHNRRSSSSIERISTYSSGDELEDRLVICESEVDSDQVTGCDEPKNSNSCADDRKITEMANTSDGKIAVRNAYSSQQTTQPVIGLKGKDLYRCGMTDCAVAVEDYHLFKEHLRTCNNARKTKNVRCRHCNNEFQTNLGFFRHIQSHGLQRFYCTLCDFKYSTQKKIIEHMKIMHKVQPVRVVPAHPCKNDLDKDNYLVIPDELSEKNNRKPKISKNSSLSVSENDTVNARKQMPTTSSTSSSQFSSEASLTSKGTDQQIIIVNSYEDVEKLLPPHLPFLPKLVNCGICNTYFTKIRTNIESHMKQHIWGLAANRDIINPVPSMGKTDGELMFNKMANYAAYSARNENKTVKTKDEQFDEDEKRQKLPAFIPKSIRFTCSVPKCIYGCHDAVNLMNHVKALHPDLERFTCPHCQLVFKITKINTHLRYHGYKLFKCSCCDFVHYQKHIVQKHQKEVHDGLAFGSPITLRELTQEEVERQEMEARNRHFDVSQNSNTGESTIRPKVDGWKCNLCKYFSSTSEDQMKNHCRLNHNCCDQRYKCPLCNFSRDSKDEIISHLKNCHSSLTQVVIPVYREIKDEIETVYPSVNCVQSKTGVIDTASDVDLQKNILLTEKPDDSSSNFVRSEQQHSPGRSATTNSPFAGVGVSCIDGTSTVCADNVNYSLTSATSTSVSEKSNIKFVEPFSDGSYKCPFCLEFKCISMEQMREHIFKEKNYVRFVCMVCGMMGFTRQDLEPHKHPEINQDYIRMLTRDSCLEEKIEQVLDYQRCRIEKMQATSNSLRPYNTSSREHIELTEPIVIRDSSDEELNSSSNNYVSTDLNSNKNLSASHASSAVSYLSKISPSSTTSFTPIQSNISPSKRVKKKAGYGGGTDKMFPCETCFKIYTTRQALSYHIRTAHAVATASKTENGRNSGNRSLTKVEPLSTSPYQRKRTPMKTSEGGDQQPLVSTDDYVCRYCIRTFDKMSLVTEHELTCIKRARRSKSQSGTAENDGAVTTTAIYSDSTCTSAFTEHLFVCVECPTTKIFPRSSELAEHELNVHKQFECLHCEKTFLGRRQLIQHLRIAAELETSQTVNTECVSLSHKDVHFLCAVCRFRTFGNTYDSYLRTADHIKEMHPELDGTLVDNNVKVQMNGGQERGLINSEITYLKLKNEFLMSSFPVQCSSTASLSSLNVYNVSAPAFVSTSSRKRNVAVKSTARSPIVSIQPPPTKIFLITQPDDQSSAPIVFQTYPTIVENTTVQSIDTSNAFYINNTEDEGHLKTMWPMLDRSELEFTNTEVTTAQRYSSSLMTTEQQPQMQTSYDIINLDDSPPHMFY